MTKSRLEAFSDGVLAILITIMVLEIHTPDGVAIDSLKPLIPILSSYFLSFVFLGIYWNNHHHLMQAVKHVNGVVLWANLHLLFWLSLVPFVTAYLGHSRFAPWPTALYGIVLLLSAIAYYILTRALLALHGNESTLARALGSDVKGKVSVVLYALGVLLAFYSVVAACGIYVLIAAIWITPDKRIEKTLEIHP